MLSPLQQRIRALAKQKNAVILAHYYQDPSIQQIADFTGDSLGLAQQAAATEADIIVFAGVHFMAETAKILNPSKKVLLPDPAAGCSLADGCPPGDFASFLQKHPDHKVITYVNCSAAVKAMSDVICTSSNAVKIVESFPVADKIIFAPDRNLGRFVMKATGRQLVLWDGSCEVHEALSEEKLRVLMSKHPDAEVVAHPESDPDLLELAHFVGSTSAMIGYVKAASASTFIVATEAGILHEMRAAAPGKALIPAPAVENNSCACSECRYMKMNTLSKLWSCLESESPEITLDPVVAQQALIPLQRMLALSGRKKDLATH